MKKLMMFAAACSALAAEAAITITDVSARQRWPWNGLVDVDFTISGAAAGEAFAIDIDATAAGGATQLSAKTYAVEPVAGAGANRIVWDLGADYPEFRANDVRISVTATPISSDKAIYMVIDLSGGSTASKYPVRYTTQAPTHVRGAADEPCQTTELWMRRIVVPDAVFTVNSYTVVADNPNSNQKQAFWGKLTKDYYIGVFELTQKQYQLVMGAWPNSWFTNEQYRASRPVDGLQYKTLSGTWRDTQAEPSTITAASFLGKIRARTGLPINLPSSTQLNFAHRGGSLLSSTSEFHRYYINGSQAVLNDIARYTGTVETKSPERDCNVNSGTAYVGSYLPNEYGIYDALGNVGEFTCEYAINTSTTTYRDYYQAHFDDNALGNTKAKPVTDPPGPSRDYMLYNSDVYRRARGGNWKLDSGYNTLWYQSNADSSSADGSNGLSGYGFRLSLTVE